MSEEVKQVKDDETAELGSVLQLSPHTPTNKTSNITRSEDGKEYISLDDVYEVTGGESFQVLAQNCRQWLKNKRLHQSGFNALMISGVEGLVPGYDRMNAVKGGESFLETLKKGFITIVKAVKKFVIMVVDWAVLRIRTLLGFEKTERELAIQADLSEDIKKELINILGDLGSGEKVKLDLDELYGHMPGNLTNIDAFTIIQNKNKTVLEQVETLEGIHTELDKAEKLILSAGANARRSASRYQQANSKLKKAFADKESFTMADIIEYRHTLDKEIMEELNAQPMLDLVSSLVEKVWGVELGEMGLDTAFKETLKKNQEKLAAISAVKIPEDLYARYRQMSENMGKAMLKATNVRFDQNQLNHLKDLIDIKDAELVQAVEAFEPGTGALVPTYAAYTQSVSNYVTILEHLINIVGQVRRSVAGVVNWANKVDKMMIAYLSRDVATILETQSQLLSDKQIARVVEKDAEGNAIDSLLNIDYDKLFVAKHPSFSVAMLTYRSKTGELRKKHKKSIETINELLRKLGANQRL